MEDLKNNGSIVLLKATDVAKILKISRSSAYQLMQKGEIPTVRIGRSVRVCESDLVTFIEECKIGSTGY